ncbi:hypothetical protein PybrP1_007966 [[Pythium] brassicae (nom. inval.)]|nr:hypothetical protein PybrP1_007966 [[Pythium] brassicae (nom. inval.)]
MQRRTRAAAAAASGNSDESAVAVPSAPAAATTATTSSGAADATDTAVGPGGARVTRERALFFATGQRTTPTLTPTPPRAIRGAHDGEQKESWPGYFSTARDLDDNRLAAQAARQEELQRKEQEDARLAERAVVWVPRKKPRTTVLARDAIVPTLQELALRCLAKHIELLPTLEYIDAAARAQVATAVVKLRRMKSEDRVAIDIPDCSNIDESSFLRTLKECLEHGLSLTTLRLGLCGRCIADDAILDLGDSLRSVEQLRMQGCYRLSDAGCEALVRRCAPSLHEFELSCNQRITKHSIDCFSELQHLQSLTLSECPQLDDAALASLLAMTSLRKLALNQMERLTDAFVGALALALPNLAEVSLARCSQLTDASVVAVFESCRTVKMVDFSDLHLLTDRSFEPIRAHGHPLQRVTIRGCIGLTDAAIENLAETTDATLQALRESCASSLEVLDLSFCRKVSEDALGVFTDECEALRSLVLWGCTQITARFLTCHSRDALLVTGHPLLTGLTIKY